MSDKQDRILVVDDQPNWRDALIILLHKEGYKVTAVTCFEEATSELSRSTFDLLVLDVRLVDVDVFNVQGLELLRLAKSKDPAPKVIMLTGYPESIREGVLDKYGADALIHKVPPGSSFNKHDFKRRVEKLIRGSSVE